MVYAMEQYVIAWKVILENFVRLILLNVSILMLKIKKANSTDCDLQLSYDNTILNQLTLSLG